MPDDLDPVAVAAQHGHHLAGDLQVGRAVAGYLDQVGAAAVRDRQRQRRVDAEAAGLVGGGHDDAAGPVLAAGRDDHGLAAQLRPAQQLDRDVEGVHVDVGDHLRSAEASPRGRRRSVSWPR